MKRSQVTQLLDEIQSIRRRRKISFAELVRELGGTSSSNYFQFYTWLVTRRYKPKGEVILKLVNWRDNYKKKYGRKVKGGNKSKKS